MHRLVLSLLVLSYAFYVDDAHEFVLVRSSETFTGTQFIEACRAFYAHPVRKPRFAHVWDTRRIDEFVVHEDVIDRYKMFLEENNEQASDDRVAIISTRHMIETLSKMMSAINRRRTHQEFTFFNDLQPACEWLDIPLEALEDIPAEQWVTSD